jgi:hypothetical protein
MKPIYGVVVYGILIRSITNIDKEAIIRKFKLENYRALSNYRIIN